MRHSEPINKEIWSLLDFVKLHGQPRYVDDFKKEDGSTFSALAFDATNFDANDIHDFIDKNGVIRKSSYVMVTFSTFLVDTSMEYIINNYKDLKVVRNPPCNGSQYPSFELCPMHTHSESTASEHKTSVKLIKVCKELDIGMATLTAWCEENGISVDSDPNYLVSDELYEKLKKHFAHKPYAGVRLEGIYGCDVILSDCDSYSQDDYDIINDAFEGDVELYNDWLLN
jgi:hypothetical protein